ncbi:protein adenylyltransferase SelO [Gluconacetobacter tumulisoli]|uniref:Protein nucleotidyltransferase YdiU n=1 Tax=Gluconacetobacter tumulisoli TaxID=1286189 RepID=A0A7W4K7X0_9PROT|nr:YdiU family protein [Gluconacetobacter tumulisoli]MBB2201933.1 YdiU family protein [Gluconacetobacter tumulisoli]
MPVSASYRPACDHLRLGDAFYDPVAAASFPAHILRFRNQAAAAEIGLDSLTDDEWIAHFGRFVPLPDGLPTPLALRYHGHQFRSYNPELGDGRGFLFAQLRDVRDGRLLDIGTKGSGRTPWSRGADGRLTLKGGVREILATEMLEALGVETSRTLSVIETGENLQRGDEPSPTRSCVLARLSHSHIRIGTFQRLAALDDRASLARLVAYVMDTYFPDRAGAGDAAVALFDIVCARVARMGAQWMGAGFVHGVLNTDNINVTGESFDYGPWRFLPRYDPAFTAAYFDHSGLYAFGRQPEALLWNLARLAECLIPLANVDDLQKIFDDFPDRYGREMNGVIVKRLGLSSLSETDDRALAAETWRFLERSAIGFEFLFFDWYGGTQSRHRAANSPNARLYESADFEPLRQRIEAHSPRPGLDLSDPYFSRTVPCTMLVETVEKIWQPIATRDDWSTLHDTLSTIGDMKAALSPRSA